MVTDDPKNSGNRNVAPYKPTPEKAERTTEGEIALPEG